MGTYSLSILIIIQWHFLCGFISNRKITSCPLHQGQCTLRPRPRPKVFKSKAFWGQGQRFLSLRCPRGWGQSSRILSQAKSWPQDVRHACTVCWHLLYLAVKHLLNLFLCKHRELSKYHLQHKRSRLVVDVDVNGLGECNALPHGTPRQPHCCTASWHLCIHDVYTSIVTTSKTHNEKVFFWVHPSPRPRSFRFDGFLFCLGVKQYISILAIIAIDSNTTFWLILDTLSIVFSVRPSTPFSADTDTPIFCCQSNTIPIRYRFFIRFKSGRGAAWLTDQRLQTPPPQLITAVHSGPVAGQRRMPLICRGQSNTATISKV